MDKNCKKAITIKLTCCLCSDSNADQDAPKKELSYAAKPAHMSGNMVANSEWILAMSYSALYNTTVNCDKRFRVNKHRDSAKHQRSMISSTTATTKQLFLPQPKKEFKVKLMKTFLAADIPLKKLRNCRVRELFTDLGQAVLSKSTCRGHVETLAEQEMDRIKKKLTGKDIFMVLDESEVSKNKYPYINVLVGDTAEHKKRMPSAAALWRLSISTLLQQR